MKASLLDYIVCPRDGQPLEFDQTVTDGLELIEGELICRAGHVYPVRKGIPRLLVSELMAREAHQTRDSFSGKWERIPNFGHEDASRDMYVNWYLQRYGFGDLKGLRDFLVGKRKVLDAGTGLGRDAVLYGKNTDGEVFALDISNSIETAYEHAGHLPNVHFIQADLTALPFPSNFFDYIACDQVLHHTSDTESSFGHLVDHLGRGGQIAVYVYKKKGPIREFSDDLLRSHYTQSPEEECYDFSRSITLLGKALSDLSIEFEVPENIPILGIKAGKQNLQRFIYWNILKCYWNDDLDFEINVMTNFDWYRPQYAHRHSPEEVRRWCAEAGLDIAHFDVIESGISVRAERR